MMYNVNFFITSFIKFSTYIKHIRNYSTQKVLNLDSMNESIIKMRYAPRGPIARKAIKHRAELSQGIKKPFKEVLLTNLGDPQGLGMCPLTFPRQIATLALYPSLMNKKKYFPSDAVKRADQILHDCLGYSLGSYTHSQGIEIVRKHIAEYINDRDGWDVEVNPEDIFTSDGASMIIKVALSFFSNEVHGKPTGVMLPVPQYPLYSAAIDLLGLTKIDYYLDEENNWNLSAKELKKSIDAAKSCCTPRALVIINPGNPTGEVKTRKALEDAVKFAYREGLFILADEVYQDNVYHEDSEFHSVRKVMIELGMPYSNMELISFHSASKGFSGECGFRAGYAELYNVDRDVKDEFIKAVSIALCSNSAGQCVLDGIICPPKENDPSYELFHKEKNCTLENLAVKARTLTQLFNGIEGIQCNPIQGALYAFPKLNLPKSFKDEAKKNKMLPDEYFCSKLLDETGICFVPGSGFGQKPGTYHFRTTILPPLEKMKSMAVSLKKFTENIMKKNKK